MYSTYLIRLRRTVWYNYILTASTILFYLFYELFINFVSIRWFVFLQEIEIGYIAYST